MKQGEIKEVPIKGRCCDWENDPTAYQKQKTVSSHTELSSNTRLLIKHTWSAIQISFCMVKEFGGGTLFKVLNSFKSLHL